ncbi:MAG: hypothetical protein J4G05_01820 [Chlorobi bacterium]|nr:hypothetical protein [Chlorobiota bacterium]
MNKEFEQHEEKGQNWWEESLNRRQVGKRLAAIGAGAALLTSAGVMIGCGGDDDFDSEEAAANAKDAIDVQKESGWNVGAESKRLALKNASPTDSKNSIDGWKVYTDPEKLRTAWGPAEEANKKFVSSELINSLNQPSLKNSVQPVHSKTMDEAYSRGLGMKELLEESKNPGSTAIVVDLPGPEAVAYAAALSDYADVVTTFDNWPHPNGVVPSQETLGAMLYYAEEVEENKEKRSEGGPTVFAMDSNRLTPYRDSRDAFDNRYIATMPTAENLKAENIESIIYTTPDQKRTEELDDLNEEFVAYRDAGIQVTMMPLTDFQPPSAESIAELGEVDEGTSSTHRTYYYGGHPYYSPFFYAFYPMFLPVRAYNYGSLRSPSTVRRPNYSPTRRPTTFSSATQGGRAGVGKTKPAGFGRVSTRTVNGKTSYTSASSRTRSSGSGRSGSFGRSGGRRSSG